MGGGRTEGSPQHKVSSEACGGATTGKGTLRNVDQVASSMHARPSLKSTRMTPHACMCTAHAMSMNTPFGYRFADVLQYIILGRWQCTHTYYAYLRTKHILRAPRRPTRSLAASSVSRVKNEGPGGCRLGGGKYRICDEEGLGRYQAAAPQEKP